MCFIRGGSLRLFGGEVVFEGLSLLFWIFFVCSMSGSEAFLCCLMCNARAISRVTHHTSHVPRHTSHLARHTSRITRHASHVTHHTSLVTRRSSHVTRHTSHVARHSFLRLWFWVLDFGYALCILMNISCYRYSIVGGSGVCRLLFRVEGLGFRV